MTGFELVDYLGVAVFAASGALAAARKNLDLLGVVVILGGVLLATLKLPVRAAAPLALDAEVSSH